ncbi:MAG: hypothetical protein M3O46_17285 [Myxococcota bacterium]|nr:hypothetical protein [Myxococcota bacterium]
MRQHLVAVAAVLLVACGSAGELLGVILTVDGGVPDGSVISADDGSAADDATIPTDDGGVADDTAIPSDDVAAADAQNISTDGARTIDGGDDAEGGSLQFVPFGPVSMLVATSDPNADNEDPSMTGDSLELYFMSTRTGNADVWVSVRPSATAPWGAPTSVRQINTSLDEGAPGVSLDGLSLWFCRSVTFSRPEIWLTTRASRSLPWGPPAPVPELNTVGRQLEPAVDESMLLIFFASDRVDAGGWDLYSSSRPTVRAVWAAPREVVELNTAARANDGDPFVGAYGLQVWFASTRTGSGDLYWSHRVSLTDRFAPPVPVKELNTPWAESDPTLSSDFRHILFASNRSGRFQIYEAWR